MKEFEQSAIQELQVQDQNHKKAVMEITKTWTEEKQAMEDRIRELEQQNSFLRTELNDYKASHDNMIKEIERHK